jgi:hypothetical protein
MNNYEYKSEQQICMGNNYFKQIFQRYNWNFSGIRRTSMQIMNIGYLYKEDELKNILFLKMIKRNNRK